MIVVQLNGEAYEFEAPLTLQELLQKIQIPSRPIAVAINSEIVPQSSFERVRLRDQDRVEIIRAVGGG